MPFTVSPNMGLIVPTVGAQPGPNYAFDVNQNFSLLIDSHDHTTGKGVPITPSGLNINSALSFNGNAAININSLVLQPLLANVATFNTIYDSNGDLWFNDGLGNQIRITQFGAVAGTPGSISGLLPPASASYVSPTFIWQSGAGITANLDCGNVIFRNPTFNSPGLTLQAPTLATNYSLTLPTLPLVQSFMTLDAAGNMAAPWTVDNVTTKIIANQLVAVTVSGEHAWELNGTYPSLTYPLTNIDSVFFANDNITITSVFIYCGTNGTAGTTEFDLKYKTSPSAAWLPILSTTGKVNAVTNLAPGSLVTTGVPPFTATCTLVGHGFVIGDSVTFAGVTPAGYNGTWTVTAATPNTFSFIVGAALGASTVGGTLATRQLVYTDSNAVIGPQAGVTKPIVSVAAIPAGSIIRWDLLQSMNTGATDARIRFYYNKT